MLRVPLHASTQAEGALLGKGVKMLVHHSRNTEQKQWDETLVLALSGTSKVLRAHLPQVAPLPGMAGGWQELMLVVESSVAGGRKETALAAIGMVATVLSVRAGRLGCAANAVMLRCCC